MGAGLERLYDCSKNFGLLLIIEQVVNMLASKEKDFISVEDYLQRELIRDTKHELVSGSIYVMAGASKNHERLSGNIYVEDVYHRVQNEDVVEFLNAKALSFR